MKNKKSVVFSILLCLVLPLLLMNCDPNVESGTFRIVGYAMNPDCLETPSSLPPSGSWDIPEEANLLAFEGNLEQAGCPFYIVVESYLAPDDDIGTTGGSQGKMTVKKIEATYHRRGDSGPTSTDVMATAGWGDVEPGELAFLGSFPMLGDFESSCSLGDTIDIIFEVSAEYAGVTYKDSKGFTAYLRTLP